jgi:hypothetical protein
VHPVIPIHPVAVKNASIAAIAHLAGLVMEESVNKVIQELETIATEIPQAAAVAAVAVAVAVGAAPLLAVLLVVLLLAALNRGVVVAMVVVAMAVAGTVAAESVAVDTTVPLSAVLVAIALLRQILVADSALTIRLQMVSLLQVAVTGTLVASASLAERILKQASTNVCLGPEGLATAQIRSAVVSAPPVHRRGRVKVIARIARLVTQHTRNVVAVQLRRLVVTLPATKLKVSQSAGNP